MLLPRPLAVGVVDPQQETPAMPACPQPVVERGADVADMQIAGRRGGETGREGHSAAIMCFAATASHTVRNPWVIGERRSRPKLRPARLPPGGTAPRFYWGSLSPP